MHLLLVTSTSTQPPIPIPHTTPQLPLPSLLHEGIRKKGRKRRIGQGNLEIRAGDMGLVKSILFPGPLMELMLMVTPGERRFFYQKNF